MCFFLCNCWLGFCSLQYLHSFFLPSFGQMQTCKTTITKKEAVVLHVYKILLSKAACVSYLILWCVSKHWQNVLGKQCVVLYTYMRWIALYLCGKHTCSWKNVWMEFYNDRSFTLKETKACSGFHVRRLKLWPLPASIVML